MRLGSHTTLSPEARLLLASAGPHGIAEFVAELNISEFDWDRLIALSERERATSVLWRQLRPLSRGVPSEVRERLDRLSMVADFNAEYLRERLAVLLDAYAAAGLRVMLLKGAGLAKTVYPAFVDRPMGDLDVLVEKADLPRASEIAKTSGWALPDNERRTVLYEKHQHAPPLVDVRGTGARLELHTDLFLSGHRFTVTQEQLLRGARRLGGERGEVYVPGNVDQLLHIAVHFAWSHMMRFGVWRMIRDVSVVTAQADVGWSQIADAAREHRAGTSCYWTLHLARRLGGVAVPDDVLQALQPRLSSRTLRALARHLELEVLPWETSCPSEKLRVTLWELAIQPRRSGHGGSRPWMSTESSRAEGSSLSRNAARQLRSFRQWWTYLRRVLSMFATVIA